MRIPHYHYISGVNIYLIVIKKIREQKTQANYVALHRSMYDWLFEEVISATLPPETRCN